MVDFLKYKFVYFIFSAIIIFLGVYSIFTWGYKFSIEFTGGSTLTISTKQKLSKEKITKILKELKIEPREINVSQNNIVIKTRELKEKEIEAVVKKLNGKLEKVEVVGPTISKELKEKTLVTAVLTILVILLYISFAFKSLTFAIAAILAAIHDSLILFGSYSFLSHTFGFEFDTLFVSAVLTTLSFSVHDTIVVFDKIREYKKELGSSLNLEYLANKALTETMVRSINNSLTIVFMLTALLLFGGEAIKHFVYALLIGTLAGTYSSPFIATPLAVIFENMRNK